MVLLWPQTGRGTRIIAGTELQAHVLVTDCSQGRDDAPNINMEYWGGGDDEGRGMDRYVTNTYGSWSVPAAWRIGGAVLCRMPPSRAKYGKTSLMARPMNCTTPLDGNYEGSRRCGGRVWPIWRLFQHMEKNKINEM